MAPRADLHAILETILGTPEHVYFQPPANLEMAYPCIVYHRDKAQTIFADDSPYRYTKRYQVTVIDRDPDSAIPDKVAKLRLCEHARYFAANNLNHDVFNLYF